MNRNLIFTLMICFSIYSHLALAQNKAKDEPKNREVVTSGKIRVKTGYSFKNLSENKFAIVKIATGRVIAQARVDCVCLEEGGDGNCTYEITDSTLRCGKGSCKKEESCIMKVEIPAGFQRLRKQGIVMM